ncbi:hypothetical protein J007_05503 [Cryptococcus neoformans]|nr:hypothetical protein J007_05503 [Cryptococcus neoformans var. grubii]OXC58931.1 hypothetical protein C358_05621 [Cryptococcus neoformans var. grubii MW-RSA852]
MGHSGNVILEMPVITGAIKGEAKGSAEREDTKKKMEENAGAEWRNGRLAVDGVLISSGFRPTIKREGFFNQKKEVQTLEETKGGARTLET